MSARSRRSVTQPDSYKDFNETGHRHAIPESNQLDQEQLMNENSHEESRNSSTSGESIDTNIEIETNANRDSDGHDTESSNESEVRLKCKQHTPKHDHDKNAEKGKHGKHAGTADITAARVELQTPRNKGRPVEKTVLRTAKKTPKKTSKNNKLTTLHTGAHSAAFTPSGEDALDINVHTDDDDLDMDRQQQSPVKKHKAGTVALNKDNTPKSKRMSVAGRLLTWPTPSSVKGKNTQTSKAHNHDHTYPNKFKAFTDKEVEAERQMLEHACREEELRQRRIRAQQSRKDVQRKEKYRDADQQRERNSRDRYDNTYVEHDNSNECIIINNPASLYYGMKHGDEISKQVNIVRHNAHSGF